MGNNMSSSGFGSSGFGSSGFGSSGFGSSGFGSSGFGSSGFGSSGFGSSGFGSSGFGSSGFGSSGFGSSGFGSSGFGSSGFGSSGFGSSGFGSTNFDSSTSRSFDLAPEFAMPGVRWTLRSSSFGSGSNSVRLSSGDHHGSGSLSNDYEIAARAAQNAADFCRRVNGNPPELRSFPKTPEWSWESGISTAANGRLSGGWLAEKTRSHATKAEVQRNTASASFIAGVKFGEPASAADRAVAKLLGRGVDGDYCNYDMPGGFKLEGRFGSTSLGRGSSATGESLGIWCGHNSANLSHSLDPVARRLMVQVHNSSVPNLAVSALALEHRLGVTKLDAGIGATYQRVNFAHLPRSVQALDLHADLTAVKNWGRDSITSARLDISVPIDGRTPIPTATAQVAHEQALNEKLKVTVSVTDCSVGPNGGAAGPRLGVSVGPRKV